MALAKSMLNTMTRRGAQLLSGDDFVLAIAGASGSGKSVQCKAIAAEFPNSEIIDLNLGDGVFTSHLEQQIGKASSDILILDEPFLGLQVEDRLRAIEAVVRFARSSKKRLVIATQCSITLSKLPQQMMVLVCLGVAADYQVVPLQLIAWDVYLGSFGDYWDKAFIRLSNVRFKHPIMSPTSRPLHEGMNAMDKKISFFRKQEAIAYLQGIGLGEEPKVSLFVEQVSGWLSQDNPQNAISLLQTKMDLAGAYRTMAILLSPPSPDLNQ